MTANQRNKLTWMTVIAYTLCRIFIFKTKVQSYGGLIAVGVFASAISIIYLKTGTDLSRTERVVEKISLIVVISITMYMIYMLWKLLGQ